LLPTGFEAASPVGASTGNERANPVPAETTEPVRRPAEIEEITNLYFVHPIASRLVRVLAAVHVRPNAVSVGGMVFGVLAGIAYSHYEDWRWTIAGFVLMVAWHVMDGADGQLARLTHSQSQSGKVLDGACDYVTFAAVYVGLALPLSRQYGDWVWVVAAVSGICHAVQSATYERQREEYCFWGWGRGPLAPAALHDAAKVRKSQRLADLLYSPYASIQLLIGGGDPRIDRTLLGSLEGQPEQASFVRDQYRKLFAPAIRRWAALSANSRTLTIFLCALARRPLWYFWIEIVALNVILIILLHGQRVLRTLFSQELRSAGPVRCATAGYRERDRAPVP